ncbi:hypothetical protein COMA1_10869 [Candidatus Nitrospira nitrosa]|uniref:Uncharacterized protein n=1 Tax=Candidatus Nitrospira nitrosa TaxID=1742972 RepID=A0A0S4LAM0_9BACT|nr:hypothetical protein COMA1_10869 [Candidatus Nitrospira nitrosa]
MRYVVERQSGIPARVRTPVTLCTKNLIRSVLPSGILNIGQYEGHNLFALSGTVTGWSRISVVKTNSRLGKTDLVIGRRQIQLGRMNDEVDAMIRSITTDTLAVCGKASSHPSRASG